MGADSLALLVDGDAGRGVPGSHGGVQVRSGPGLRGGRRGLQLLERPDLVHPFGVVHLPVQPGEGIAPGAKRRRTDWCCIRGDLERVFSNMCSTVSGPADMGPP